MKRCAVVYLGPSYPFAHGTRCEMAAGHDAGDPHRGQKHRGTHKGTPMEWFTEDQKTRRGEMHKEGLA